MDRPTNELPKREKEAETRRDWEVIQENVGLDKTERLKIVNGWLYRIVTAHGSVAVTFVPSKD